MEIRLTFQEFCQWQVEFLKSQPALTFNRENCDRADFWEFLLVAATAGRMQKVAESEADLMSVDRSRFGIERR